MLESQYNKLRRLSAGGVQPNLNLSIIRGIEIPLPPAAEQEKIISQLDSWSFGMRRLHSTVAHLQIRGGQLRKQLIEQAFRGKLVPQNLNGEPASVLLNQIRIERATRMNKSRPSASRSRESTKSRAAPPPPPVSILTPITAVQQELPW